MRRFFFPVAGLLLLYGCGGGGGLGDPNVHYRNFDIDIGAPHGTYLTRENHEVGWNRGDCLSCHQIAKHTAATYDISVDKYQNLIEKAVDSVGKKNAIQVCSACHGANGVSSVQRKCLVCHDKMSETHFYAGSSSRKYFHDFNGNGKLDDFDCVVCHWQPDMDGVVEFDTDLAEYDNVVSRNTSDFCLKCHSNNWANLKGQPLADTDGDGIPDEKVNPTEFPPEIKVSWINDFHGEGEANATLNATFKFKDIYFEGDKLFYIEHEPLECVQCHNPHASKNDKLIVEKVGETLTIVQEVEQKGYSKFALIDPRTYKFFEDMEYSGLVNGENETYDLSNSGNFSSYVNLPVFNNDSNVTANRETIPSLCASCHGGNETYASNGLGLSVDINSDHNQGHSCVECHAHGNGTF